MGVEGILKTSRKFPNIRNYIYVLRSLSFIPAYTWLFTFVRSYIIIVRIFFVRARLHVTFLKIWHIVSYIIKKSQIYILNPYTKISKSHFDPILQIFSVAATYDIYMQNSIFWSNVHKKMLCFCTLQNKIFFEYEIFWLHSIFLIIGKSLLNWKYILTYVLDMGV